jgi:tetratricopeptide (TPR) repeat protein
LPSEAEALLRRAIGLDPATIEGRNELAHFLITTGRLEEAEHILREILTDEDHVWTRNMLGLVLYKQGKLVDSEAEHLRNCKNHPQSADPSRLLGAFYCDVGRFDDAERAYRAAVAIDPRCAESTYRLAAFLRRRGSNKEASQWVRKALELDPHDARAVALNCELESMNGL